MVDYVSVFKALPGYSGWVVVEAEQDPKKAQPANYAKMGYDNLKRFLQGRRAAVMSQAAGQAAEPTTAASSMSRRRAPAGPMSASICGSLAGRDRQGETQGPRDLPRLRHRQGPRRRSAARISASSASACRLSRASPGRSMCRPARPGRSTAETALELGVCSAPGDGQAADRASSSRMMSARRRAARAPTRAMSPTSCPRREPAESLLVVEVITPGGHTSSYPPHKHDHDDLPHESLLEETYYHRFNPPQGFAFQRVYTDDRSLDETMAVEDGDVTLVPKGYHPCAAPHGYDLYYLNVMAGPKRTWKFHNAPEHEWLIAR